MDKHRGLVVITWPPAPWSPLQPSHGIYVCAGCKRLICRPLHLHPSLKTWKEPKQKPVPPRQPCRWGLDCLLKIGKLRNLTPIDSTENTLPAWSITKLFQGHPLVSCKRALIYHGIFWIFDDNPRPCPHPDLTSTMYTLLDGCNTFCNFFLRIVRL